VKTEVSQWFYITGHPLRWQEQIKIYCMYYFTYETQQFPVQLWIYCPSLGLLIKILHDLFFQQETLK
jgi:hypothetical protein